MKPDLRCDDVRVELSARLDGEVTQDMSRLLDEHLASCADCRAHEAELRSARQAVRLQPAGRVPDLADAIMARITAETPRLRARERWVPRVRIASVAAAAAALVLIGTSIPFDDDRPDTASANEIVSSVRAAARDLSAYRADFSITERGWHPDIPLRRFEMSVGFVAPEHFRMSITDLTTYPRGDAWPRNDVELIAGPSRWWIREPSSCPPAALPDCDVETKVEERSVVHRKPFDGTSALPTDIVVPLETLASSGGFDVVAGTQVAGRDAYRVALTYEQATPLVTALQPGGSWRTFEPGDRVDLWIDRATWFPLKVEIRSGAGEPDLVAAATSFSEEATPVGSPPKGGIVRNGGFDRRPFATIEQEGSPTFVGNLDPYRAGVTRDDRAVLSYTDGMTWLRFERERIANDDVAYPLNAEEILLSRAGYAYYQPADRSFKRRIDLYGDGIAIHLESNLPRGQLLRVANSLPISGSRAPRWVQREDGLYIRRLTPIDIGLLRPQPLYPDYLPTGYRPSSGFLLKSQSGARTVTIYYRRAEAEYDGVGIRITRSPRLHVLPPSSEEFQEVVVAGVKGRWSQARGELEWVDGFYRAVAAPGLELATILRIAESLR